MRVTTVHGIEYYQELQIVYDHTMKKIHVDYTEPY
jgi:hypothetical protein